MTIDSDDRPDATVVRLPVRHEPSDLSPVTDGEELSETSFEVTLDDEPGMPAPLPVDTVSREPVLHPVIPSHLNTWGGVRSTAARKTRHAAHHTKYHFVRSPKYLALAVLWGVCGLFKGAGRQLRWWWLAESAALRNHAVDKNDGDIYLKLQKESKQTRYTRGRWLLAQLSALAVGGILLWFLAPWWSWLIVTGVALPFLAHIGRPNDKPIISRAVVAPRFRVISADAVLRAYYAAGLGTPDKPDPKTGTATDRPDMKITFETIMSRDKLDKGSQVKVVLPYGKTFTDAKQALEKIASGLDVSLSQVYLTKDPDSNRRHLLWIADEDPLAIPAGRTPLLDCKPRDIWRPAPLGLDERGQRVAIELVFYSILFGAPPRRGKTWSARLIALYAALDPYVRLSVFDGKGSPDWKHFALVAHTYGFGLLPNRVQGDPIENLLATLRTAKKEIQERNNKLCDLPTSECPDGKLTRDIARNVKKYRMPVWVIVLDEIQEFLTTGDNDVCLEILQLLVSVVKVGPSVGVIVESSTQRPSGIGSTVKIRQLFTDYRDNHLARFALKTPSFRFSDLVLGDGAHMEGYDSSVLPVGDKYRGIGILYNSSIDNCTVRSYLADGEDTHKILLAARKHRERVGTLDGMAAGESIATQARDPLTDVLDAFLPAETWLSWVTLADRLAEQLPEGYAQGTPDALSHTLRDLKLGIESRSGRDDTAPGGTRKGVHRAALERAVERRNRDETSR